MNKLLLALVALLFSGLAAAADVVTSDGARVTDADGKPWQSGSSN
jgi:hypothetical protein